MASMRKFPIREWNGGSCRMQDKLKKLIGDNINFVFVGEAGSGKSEISINFAKWLVQLQDKPVHFFDQATVSLQRCRDADGSLGDYLSS